MMLTWVLNQKKGYPQIIHFNRVFHYKPSILGYPYFWKHPLRVSYSSFIVHESDGSSSSNHHFETAPFLANPTQLKPPGPAGPAPPTPPNNSSKPATSHASGPAKRARKSKGLGASVFCITTSTSAPIDRKMARIWRKKTDSVTIHSYQILDMPVAYSLIYSCLNNM